MFQNEHICQSPERAGWLRFFVCVGVTLALAGSVCTPSRALAAFEWPSVNLGAMDETNVRVTMIQYLLRSRDYAVAVNGHYGRQTQQAVRRFQASHGLKVNGIVGARTWRELIVTLKLGSHGDAVCAIQVPLREVSDGNLPVNGRFDSRTERAVRAFQRNNGLPIDGIVGKVTWMHLTENIYD